MKKLFAILLTLLMIVALPLTAFADEAVTSHDPSETAPTEDVAAVGGADASDVEVSEETEPVGGEEDAPKTQFGFFPETLAETLPIMGMGMLGIFLVTLVIILAVLVLSKLGNKKEEE